MAFDLDTVFGYYTVKYAHIRDRRLGFIQKGLMLAIAIKIGALTVVYQCHHLLEVPVIGSARANAQQPTQNGCNPMDPDCMSDFTPLSKLKYCSQYAAGAGDKEEDGKKETKRMLAEEKKYECQYWDAPAMTRGRSPVPGTLFMPTRITTTNQKVGCVPDEKSNFECKTKPWVHAEGDYTSEIMVAEIERFTVLINQAFSADMPGKDIGGRAADYTGFAKGRPDLVDFYTSNAKTKGHISLLEKSDKKDLKHISKLHEIPAKPDHKGDFLNVFSLQGNGDVFEVGDILRMADLRGAALLDEVREDGTTMRSAGGVIAVDITYSNDKKMDIFGQKDPIYIVSAKFIPMKYYKIMYEEFDNNYHTTRKMHNVHGLLFLFQVKGAIKVFSLVHLLTVLSTAMVSLALASTLTDYIMSYAPCLGLKDHYNILKFQPTMDFGDLEDRIQALKAECATKNIPFDPAKIKASACSKVINEYAMQKKPLDPATMLNIICVFEQRLNRLDGMDAANDDDSCAKVVQEFKKQNAS